jgi:hypothetical protein
MSFIESFSNPINFAKFAVITGFIHQFTYILNDHKDSHADQMALVTLICMAASVLMVHIM